MLPPENLDEQRQELAAARAGRRRRERRLTMILVFACLLLAVTTTVAYFSANRAAIGGSAGAVSAGVADDTRINVLLIGADRREADIGRSDTLMLASFDSKTGALGVMSIPRDTRVRIPGHRGYTKINAAFGLGGPELVTRTVAELLDVHIDYYVTLDFAGFEKVVDTLGGVTINVAKRMYYVDRAQKLIIDLDEGPQRLDGRRALGYVRFRHDRLGDVALVDPASGQYEGRVERQLQFVRALAKQALQPQNLLRAPKIIRQVYEAIDTNMPLERITTLAMAARKLKADSVKTFVLPGTSGTLYGASYWLVDEEAAQKVVREMVAAGEENRPVRVAVLNGSGRAGVAGKAAEQLRAEGYQVVSVGNADSFDYDRTQVIAMADKDARAATMVAKALGVKAGQEGKDTPSVDAEVAVIVGRDWP